MTRAVKPTKNTLIQQTQTIVQSILLLLEWNHKNLESDLISTFQSYSSNTSSFPTG